MSRIVKEIEAAVRSGRLGARFTARACRDAISGFADCTFPTFLPKHRKGNPGGYSEYFRRIKRGLYELLRR